MRDFPNEGKNGNSVGCYLRSLQFHPHPLQFHRYALLHSQIAQRDKMGGSSRDVSIQQFFLPTPTTSPCKKQEPAVGDGFTAEEIQEALAPKPREWHPEQEYEDCEISALEPGPKAVTFMGRVGNIFDVGNTQKTPRSAKGCIKICLKDGMAAITVRLCRRILTLNIR